MGGHVASRGRLPRQRSQGPGLASPWAWRALLSRSHALPGCSPRSFLGLLWQPAGASRVPGCGGWQKRRRQQEQSMRASVAEPLEPSAGDSGSRIHAEHEEGGQPWMKCIYVAPPRRVKEVLEEELYFRRDECRIKHPSEVALERIWSLKRNFPMGGFKLASQNQGNLLSQPKYYSRHAAVRR